MITKNKTGKYLVRYSRSNSEPLMGLTFQHLEIQGGVDFRLCITKIASVQKTCGIDPKVLARMIYNGSSWCELGSQDVEASTYSGDRGEAQLQNEPVLL
jgi:hypothetical protein